MKEKAGTAQPWSPCPAPGVRAAGLPAVEGAIGDAATTWGPKGRFFWEEV